MEWGGKVGVRAMSGPRYVTTVEAAQAMGISVSTVKRWVDEGILPAHKTAGGHRKVLADDLVRMVRQGNYPRADLTRLTEAAVASAEPTPADLGRELLAHLRSGDSAAIRTLILGAYRAGVPLETLADSIVAPAMERIGHEWQAGRIEVMHEHRATQLVVSALFELKGTLESSDGSLGKPRAVGGAVEGDHSILPSLLAQMILIEHGWEVVNLGPHTPIGSLRRALGELRPRMIWLSSCHLDDADAFTRDYTPFFREAEQAGTAVALGGRAFGEHLRATLPCSTFGATLSHLAAFARTLHPRPIRPLRGRPPKG